MKIRQLGFTLIEVMVVVTIAAVLASLAIPSFRTLMQKRALQAAADALVSDMRLARTEALKRSARVVICSLADNSTTACSGVAQKWINGWIVFVDANSNGIVDAGDDVVRVQQPMLNIASIQSTLSPSTDLNKFTYEAAGWAKAATQTLVFTPSGSTSGNVARIVCISMNGRPSLRPEGTASCL